MITDSLCPAVAWRHKFKSEFAERCDGAVDRQWLDALAAMLYPLNSDRDPRRSAEVAFATLEFEFLMPPR